MAKVKGSFRLDTKDSSKIPQPWVRFSLIFIPLVLLASIVILLVAFNIGL